MLCPNKDCNRNIAIDKEQISYCPYCGFNFNVFFKDDSAMLDCAKRFINKKLYSDAANLLKKSCKLGNSNAMYEYGKLFINGLGVTQNDNNVLYCMHESYKRSNENATLFLIDVFLKGLYGKPASIKVAHELFKRLSEETKKQHKDLSDIFENDNDNETAVAAIGKVDEFDGNIEIKEFKEPIPKINSKNCFEEEKTKLQEYYKTTNPILEYYENAAKSTPFDPLDFSGFIFSSSRTESMARLKREIKTLNAAKPNPYIGRMILNADDGEGIDDFYIGKEYIKDINGNYLVYSWFSPLVQKIYDDIHTHWDIEVDTKYKEGKKNTLSIAFKEKNYY